MAIDSSPARSPSPLWLIPWALYAYPTVAGLLAKSIVPTIFGRYSRLLFAFNAWNVLLIVVGLVCLRRGSFGTRTWLFLLLIATSMLATFNGEVQAWPALAIVLPVTRLSAAAALVALEFLRYRSGGKARGAVLALAGGMLAFSVADLGLGVVQTWRIATGRAFIPTGFRQEYDLGTIGPGDVVIVGDSYVWGAGVQPDEAFGQVMAKNRAQRGRKGSVFSLGVNGASTDKYLEIIRSLPAGAIADRVVLAFYLNDIEAVPDWRDRVVGVCTALRHGCPLLGLAGDQWGKMLLPDAHADHRAVARRYDMTEPTFGQRRELLRSRLAEFHAVAVAHSTQKPLFLLLPMMVDFQDYALAEAHADLISLAQEIGFDTHDLLPSFRESLGSGYDHWATDFDNHFDAAAHRVAAVELDARLGD